MLRSQGACWLTVADCPVRSSYMEPRRRKSFTRTMLSAPRTTATTKRLSILGGPLPWTFEPTHSAKRGLPVHAFNVTTAMAAASATRFTRTRTPRGAAGVLAGELLSGTASMVGRLGDGRNDRRGVWSARRRLSGLRDRADFTSA